MILIFDTLSKVANSVCNILSSRDKIYKMESAATPTPNQINLAI